MAVLDVGVAKAQYGHGSTVGCGEPVVGGDLSADFVTVAPGGCHSLGLKADGLIVPWGDNSRRQCDVPELNTGFGAVVPGGVKLIHAEHVRSQASL